MSLLLFLPLTCLSIHLMVLSSGGTTPGVGSHTSCERLRSYLYMIKVVSQQLALCSCPLTMNVYGVVVV